jgi:polyisoprenoid-binding protein YceI
MRTHSADAIGAPNIRATRWQIDPTRSAVEFRARGMWGMAAVKGAFSRYHGTLDLSARPAIELTVETDSLDTKNKRRDAHLGSPDFFSVEAHPYVRFVSDRVIVNRERLSVRGRLHARGATVPVNLDATLREVGGELEIEAVTEADQRKLGMTWNVLGMIRTPTKLIVKGRLVREESDRRWES